MQYHTCKYTNNVLWSANGCCVYKAEAGPLLLLSHSLTTIVYKGYRYVLDKLWWLSPLAYSYSWGHLWSPCGRCTDTLAPVYSLSQARMSNAWPLFGARPLLQLALRHYTRQLVLVLGPVWVRGCAVHFLTPLSPLSMHGSCILTVGAFSHSTVNVCNKFWW